MDGCASIYLSLYIPLRLPSRDRTVLHQKYWNNPAFLPHQHFPLFLYKLLLYARYLLESYKNQLNSD
ncbi:hypothetical protein GJ744_006891 [Endocarpon pusillum]|uniref:Uncharacterized protein n=1 Tax=Endocarpon pusillum TaxID=364733 RepID=A0A8H7A7N8_9EURO|nr:hypothetical protein GJ744_006891 [Endocarpon pusillum]